MRYIWTNDDIEFLKNNYEILSIDEISKILNKSEKSIQTKLGLLKKYDFQDKKRQIVKTSANTSNWTTEEDNYIKENHNKYTCKEIGLFLNKSQGDVRLKILSLGLDFKRINKKKQYSNWKSDEIEYIKDNYLYKTRKQLASELNKTENVIRAKLIELHLKKINRSGNNKPWSKNENDILINICKDDSIKKKKKLSTIVEKLNNRTIIAINQQINKLDLRKYVCFCETLPEKKVRDILIKLNVDFTSQYKLESTKYIIDFVVNNNAIEIQGDYWHCNPSIYINGPKNDIQKNKIENDKKKKLVLESLGYNVIYFWEYDINHNIKMIENEIKKIIK